MSNYFKLTTETKVNVFGVTLFRLELTIDCKWGKAGTKGGWVDNQAKIDNLGTGSIMGGEIWGDAKIWGGEIWGGEIWGGVIRGGVIWGDAKIRGGEIWGGVIRGGEIRGGVIWGGVIMGGEIWGGVIRGGEIWGGVIRGGDWKVSPLQIQGTRHFFNICAKGKIQIGCKSAEITWWYKNFKSVGKQEGYTPEQIEEYGLYIKLAKKLDK